MRDNQRAQNSSENFTISQSKRHPVNADVHLVLPTLRVKLFLLLRNTMLSDEQRHYVSRAYKIAPDNTVELVAAYRRHTGRLAEFRKRVIERIEQVAESEIVQCRTRQILLRIPEE